MSPNLMVEIEHSSSTLSHVTPLINKNNYPFLLMRDVDTTTCHYYCLSRVLAAFAFTAPPDVCVCALGVYLER